MVFRKMAAGIPDPLGLGFLLLLALSLFSGTGRAEEDSSEVYDLGRLTVMAPQPGVEITTEKTIIRMDEFSKPGEVRTLTDVLTEIGGIDVQRTNPLMASPGDEVSIRGLNEGRMVIEIDGRRINHTGHYGRYIVDWSTLNMDDIDHIEVIRGGHSVLHPFAIGGVINIVTKKGKKVAVVIPVEDYKPEGSAGLISAKGALAGIDDSIDDMVAQIYSARETETDRKVEL